jgi:hypothetical protein
MSKKIIAKSVVAGTVATVSLCAWLVIAAGFMNVAL